MTRSLPLALLIALLALGTVRADEERAPLRSGPMLGYVSLRSATLWVQTTRPASVQLRYWPQADPAQARLTDPVTTRKQDDLCLTLLIDGLKPGTRYDYELYLDGVHVARPYRTDWTTRPLWQWRTSPPDTTLMLGSCSFINEDPYDRPGRPYGGGYEIFQTMAKVKADAMFWLGDNVYLREVDWNTREGIAARYRWNRSREILQALLANQPNYAIWDDHDFGPNDSDKTYPLRGHSLEVFKRYWPAVVYGTPETPGTFQHIALADAEIFLLDDRYHRNSNKLTAGKNKRMLGKRQMKWLKESLLSARATFKLIMNGNQVLNDRTPYESMANLFPQEKKELVDWIVEQRIEGVVFVSGDRHHTELQVHKVPGGYPLYEFTCSPLTSGAHKLPEDHPEFEHPQRVPGTLVGERNYALLKLEGPARDRKVAIEVYRTQGERIWRHEIKRSQLGWTKKKKGKLH